MVKVFENCTSVQGQNLGQLSNRDSTLVKKSQPGAMGDTLVAKPEQRFLGSDTLNLPGSDFYQNVDLDSLVSSQLPADTLKSDSTKVPKVAPKSDIEISC